VRSNPAGGKRRKLICEQDLDVEDIDVEDLVALGRDVVGAAFDLLLDDEVRLWSEGRPQAIFLGRWLTDAGGRPRRASEMLRARLTAAVEAALRSYMSGGGVPEITQVQALAAISRIDGAPVDRTRLLSGLHPRAQLLAPIAAVLLSLADRLPPLGAWSFSTHAGPAGDEAAAYGTHKQPGAAASERLLTLDVLGGDARAVVAMSPIVTGTRDDPQSALCTSERRDGFAALVGFDVAPPSAPADHLQPLLELANAARRLLLDAAEHRAAPLRGFGGLDVARLRQSLPAWALAGPFSYGPYTPPADLHAARYWPGTDAAALQAASARRIPMLALAFDSATVDTGGVPGLERMVLASRMWAGTQLAEILSSAGRVEVVPELRQEPAAALATLNDWPEARLLGVEFEPAIESALTLAAGLRLATAGDPHAASLLLHSSLAREDARTPTGTLAWTSNVDLNDPGHRRAAIVQAQLHRRALRPRPPLGACIARTFRAFDVHRIKTGEHATRCYLRLVAMLANLVIVGEGRSSQALSAAT
jgi:hypothetical protein